MKEKYNKKKYVVISILSFLAVGLAMCLTWYMGTLGKMELPAVKPEILDTEPTISVPEIDIGGIMDTEKESGSTQVAEGTGLFGAEDGETEETVAEISIVEETITLPETLPFHSEESSEMPKGAEPPSGPPSDAENTAEVENPDRDGVCHPEHTSPQEKQPQGGDTNPAGAVYVPGFGYIESSGSNEQGISHTDGDWNKQIGTM